MREYCVRVAKYPEDFPLDYKVGEKFLEALNAAGSILKHEDSSVFDILYPRKFGDLFPAENASLVWAKKTARLLESLGFNAVYAPCWSELMPAYEVCEVSGCGNASNYDEDGKAIVLDAAICWKCKDAGWTLDDSGQTVEPLPEKGQAYYSGRPLYRCQHCGIRGGH
jgi:hypothetical protein